MPNDNIQRAIGQGDRSRTLRLMREDHVEATPRRRRRPVDALTDKSNRTASDAAYLQERRQARDQRVGEVPARAEGDHLRPATPPTRRAPGVAHSGTPAPKIAVESRRRLPDRGGILLAENAEIAVMESRTVIDS